MALFHQSLPEHGYDLDTTPCSRNVAVLVKYDGFAPLIWNRHNKPSRTGRKGGKSEELAHKTDVAYRAGLCQSTVAAADHAHRFAALEDGRGCFHPLETARQLDDTLERPVVRPDDVVEVL